MNPCLSCKIESKNKDVVCRMDCFAATVVELAPCGVVDLTRRRHSAPSVFGLPSSNKGEVVLSCLVVFLDFDFILIVFVVGVIVKSVINGAQQHLPHVPIRRSVVNHVPVDNISEWLCNQHHRGELLGDIWACSGQNTEERSGEHVQFEIKV